MSIRLLICISVWGDNCSDVPASQLGSTSAYTPNAPTRFSPTLPTTFVTRPCENCNWALIFPTRRPRFTNRTARAWELTPNLSGTVGAEGTSQVIPGSSPARPPLWRSAQGAGAASHQVHLEFTNVLLSLHLLWSKNINILFQIKMKSHPLLPSAPDLLYQTLKILPSSALPSVLSRDTWTLWVLYPPGYSSWLFFNHFISKDYITLGEKKFDCYCSDFFIYSQG